jgi:hypothetical protein
MIFATCNTLVSTAAAAATALPLDSSRSGVRPEAVATTKLYKKPIQNPVQN